MGDLGTLALVRHGESVGNARGLFSGMIDMDLTPEGEAACTEAGRRLAEEGWHPDVVVTSELHRGLRTAELVLEAMDLDAPVVRSWRLNERSYGALSGYSKAEVMHRFGREQFLHWRRSYEGRPPPLDEETLAVWRSLPPFDRLPPEALPPTESLADVVVRLRPYWTDDLVPRLDRGEDVLVAAHGNTLRALAAVLDDLDGDELRELNLPNARPLLYTFERSPRGLVPAVRGGRYLDPDLARKEAAVIAAQGGT